MRGVIAIQISIVQAHSTSSVGQSDGIEEEDNMKLQFPRVVLSTIMVVGVTGCASQGGGPGSGIDPFCAAVGGALGGGTAAIISLAAGPVGAGVGVGALLGALACHDRAPVETTNTSTVNSNTQSTPVAVAPAPVATPEVDSDGDGVVDRLDRCPNTPAGTKVDVNGCPDLLLSLTGINFKFDSSVIEPTSSDILDRAVASLNESKDVAVRIEGHCDSTGGDAYNQMLSERRGNAVKDYLVAHGIAAERMNVVGKGESTPVASNDTEEGRFQNRRVEFHVAGEAAAAPRAGNDSGQTPEQPGSTQ